MERMSLNNNGRVWMEKGVFPSHCLFFFPPHNVFRAYLPTFRPQKQGGFQNQCQGSGGSPPWKKLSFIDFVVCILVKANGKINTIFFPKRGLWMASNWHLLTGKGVFSLRLSMRTRNSSFHSIWNLLQYLYSPFLSLSPTHWGRQDAGVDGIIENSSAREKPALSPITYRSTAVRVETADL